MAEERNDMQTNKNLEKEGEQEVYINPDNAKGNYANYLRVNHSGTEFLLDFFIKQPSHTLSAGRILVNPIYIKDFVKTLQENIEKYEERYNIKLPENPQDYIDNGILKLEEKEDNS